MLNMKDTENDVPCNMTELCRLCLSRDGGVLPIFGEEEGGNQSVPLSFRILACVSIEISLNDGLPKLICQNCLSQVNTWHTFKQICDSSQATLKEWLSKSQDQAEPEKTIEVKQEPPDEDDMIEIHDADVEEMHENVEDVEEMHQNVDELHQNVDELHPSVEEMHQSVEELHQSVEEMHQSVEEMHQNVEGLHQNVEVVHQNIEEMHENAVDVEEMHQNEDEMHQNVEEMHQNVEEMQQNMEEMQQNMEEMHQNMEEMHQNVADVEGMQENADSRDNSALLVIKQEPIEVCDVPDDEDLSNIEVLHDPLSLTIVDSSRLLPVIRPIKSEPIVADDLLMLEHSDEDDMKDDDKDDTGVPDIGQDFDLPNNMDYDEKKEIKLESMYSKKRPKKRRSLTLRKRKSTLSSEISYSDYVEPEIEPPLLSDSKERYFCFPAPDGKQHYYCIPCGKSFPFKSYYMRHEKVHRKSHHVCSFCDRQFSCRSNLVRHVRLHTGQKPYTCQDCSAGFQNRSEYMKHKTVCIAFTAKQEVPEPEKTEKPEPLAQPPEITADSKGDSYPCYICRQTFDNIHRLQIHRRSHADFRCRRCGKSFNGGVALSNHLRTHNFDGFKRYSCKICKKTFSSVTSLVSHKRFHLVKENTVPKPPKATKKPAAVVSKPSTKQTNVEVHKFQTKQLSADRFFKSSKHLQISEGDSRYGYNCSVCHKWVKTLSVLKRHMTSHTKLKLFSCVICNISMGYASSLHKHMRIAHSVEISYKDIRAMCAAALAQQEKICLEKQMGQSSIDRPKNPDAEKNRSVSSVSPIEDEEEVIIESESTREYGYQCSICLKTFSNKRLLDNHTKIIHMGGRAYKCNICSKLFAYKHLLIKHARLHSGEEDTVFTCNVCSKTFADLKTLNNHKGVHTRFKHYSCPICSKSFNGLKNWEQHQMLHTSNIRYKCKLCGKTFLSKAELNEHKKMHIKLKIYTCGICKNSYNSMKTLNSHKRRKHADMLGMSPYENFEDEINDDDDDDVDVFACDVCTKPFPDSMSLSKHKLIHVKRDFNKMEDEVMSSTSESVSGNLNYLNPNWKFPCLQCQRDFPDQSSLSKHKGWHSRRSFDVAMPLSLKTKKKMYTCGLCGRAFANSGSLSKHRRISCPAKKMYNTDIVSANYLSKSQTQSMKTASHVVRPILHSVKAASYVSKPAFMKTGSSVSRPPLVKAPHVTKQLLVAKKPKPLPTSNTPKPEKFRRFPCLMCDRFFSNKKALIRHKGWHTRCPTLGKEQPKPQPPPASASPQPDVPSPSPPAVLSQPPPLQLPPPPQPQVMPLLQQEQIVSEKVGLSLEEEMAILKRLTCDICFKVYSSGSTLSRHKRLHKRKLLVAGIKSVKQPPPVVEENDGKITLNSEGLYLCRYCKKPFRFRRQLVDHERVHTGERPFTCNQCPLTFSRRAILWRHKKTHLGIRPFSCTQCPKTFLMNFQLTRHMTEKHTFKDTYACYRCGKTFRFELALRKHEQSQHPE